MRETKQGKNDVVVIDVKRVLGAVWHRIWMILLVAVLCVISNLLALWGPNLAGSAINEAAAGLKPSKHNS